MMCPFDIVQHSVHLCKVYVLKCVTTCTDTGVVISRAVCTYSRSCPLDLLVCLYTTLITKTRCVP